MDSSLEGKTKAGNKEEVTSGVQTRTRGTGVDMGVLVTARDPGRVTCTAGG